MERMWPLELDIPGVDTWLCSVKYFGGLNDIIHAELLTQGLEQCRCSKMSASFVNKAVFNAIGYIGLMVWELWCAFE